MIAKLVHGSRAVLCAALLVLAVACVKKADDAKVASDIQAKLAADSGLQDKQLTVLSANGTVTLSGVVDTQAERDAAAKYAASEPGVKTVINNLQVGSMQAVSMQAGSQPTTSPSPDPSEAMNSKASPSRRKKPQTRAAERVQGDAPQIATNTDAPAAPAASQPAYPTASAQTPSAPPPPPEPAPVTVPSGAVLSVRLIDTIDTATAQTGDKFHATLDSPLAVDGDVVVPAHYEVEGHIVNAQSSGKFQGQAMLVLELDRLKVGDKYYDIQTDQFSQKTGSRGKNTAEKVGAGAVAGAILGGIFGGGKGAAIGSAAGAGAGGGVQAASKKPDIKLSSEKVLTFTLQAPVTLVPTTKPAREGQRLTPATNP